MPHVLLGLQHMEHNFQHIAHHCRTRSKRSSPSTPSRIQNSMQSMTPAHIARIAHHSLPPACRAQRPAPSAQPSAQHLQLPVYRAVYSARFEHLKHVERNLQHLSTQRIACGTYSIYCTISNGSSMRRTPSGNSCTQTRLSTPLSPYRFLVTVRHPSYFTLLEVIETEEVDFGFSLSTCKFNKSVVHHGKQEGKFKSDP